MQRKRFVVSRIEGEYAYLTDLDSDDEVFIALALLPFEADIGSVVVCEDFSYSLE